MLLTPDLDEPLIDVERIAATPVLSPQPPGKYRPKLDTPEPHRLVADRNTPFGQQLFDIPMAQVESMIQPDRVADDVGRNDQNRMGGRLQNTPTKGKTRELHPGKVLEVAREMTINVSYTDKS